MIKRACLLSILVVAGAMTMASCGGGGGSSTPITVNITTDVSNIETFQTVQFAASVTGTSNTAVTWQLACGAAGAVCGSLTTSGMYVAPNTVPTVNEIIDGGPSTDPANVTVTAISQANTAVSQSVAFTIDSLNMQPLTAPVKLGSSGGNANAICGSGASEFCFGGTLGSLVTGGGKSYILSNNHVLGLSDGGAIGQAVTQPGVIETNCSTTGTITVANVSNIINLQTQPIPAFPVDVTTAQIISGEVDANARISACALPLHLRFSAHAAALCNLCAKSLAFPATFASQRQYFFLSPRQRQSPKHSPLLSRPAASISE